MLLADAVPLFIPGLVDEPTYFAYFDESSKSWNMSVMLIQERTSHASRLV